MAQENRELQLEQALSGLVDNYYELHSNGEWCPACGGEYIEDDDALLSTKHDDDCALAVAVKLLVPSLNQDSGITPENLLDALIRHHIPNDGVIDITSPTDIDGVIIFTPDYSWYFGIHGENPEWDGNGYLDWNMHRTGIEDDKPYLDEYIGMGVADDSKGWSLDQMVAKIAQVIRDKELDQTV